MEQPIDITGLPGLSQLVADVRASQRPRILRRAGEDVAVLAPLPASPIPRVTRTHRKTASALAVVERTAGLFRDAAKCPPATAAEETAAFEQGVADEVMRGPRA